MPDEYGNPTFKDIFDNPEVFKELYNVYRPATASGVGYPSVNQPQPTSFQYHAPAQVPVPSTKLTAWDQLRNAMQVVSGGLTDATRIYQHAPVEGLGAKYLTQQEADQADKEQQAARAQMFNAQQENQYGLATQKQAFEAARLAQQQADITARTNLKIDSQTEEAKQNRLAADARAAADRQSRIDLENLRAKNAQDLELMKEKAAAGKPTAAEKNLSDKEADAYAQLDALEKNLTDYETTLKGFVGKHPSQTARTSLMGMAAAAEPRHSGGGGVGATIMNALTTATDPDASALNAAAQRVRTQMDRIVFPTGRPPFQLLQQLRGSVPGGEETLPSINNKLGALHAMLNQLKEYKTQYLQTSRGATTGVLAPGQRAPSPQPPPAGTVKKSLDDIWNESR